MLAASHPRHRVALAVVRPPPSPHGGIGCQSTMTTTRCLAVRKTSLSWWNQLRAIPIVVVVALAARCPCHHHCGGTSASRRDGGSACRLSSSR